MRAQEFVPQLDERDATLAASRRPKAFMLIFRGLFKKVVISSYLASRSSTPVFADAPS